MRLFPVATITASAHRAIDFQDRGENRITTADGIPSGTGFARRFRNRLAQIAKQLKKVFTLVDLMQIVRGSRRLRITLSLRRHVVNRC